LALNHLVLVKPSKALAAVSLGGFSELAEMTTAVGIAETWLELALSPSEFLALTT